MITLKVAGILCLNLWYLLRKITDLNGDHSNELAPVAFRQPATNHFGVLVEHLYPLLLHDLEATLVALLDLSQSLFALQGPSQLACRFRMPESRLSPVEAIASPCLRRGVPTIFKND